MEELLLPDESIITRTDDDIVVLTSYRVRYNEGKSYTMSLMLDTITSVEVRNQSWPIILMLGLVCLVGSVAAIAEREGELASGLFVVAGLLIVGYLLSRRHVLRISSPSSFVQFTIKGMGTEKVMEFVNKVEGARVEFLKTIRR